MIQAPTIKNENYRYTSFRNLKWNEPPRVVPANRGEALPAVFGDDPLALFNQLYAGETKRIHISNKQNGETVAIGVAATETNSYARLEVIVDPGVSVTLVDELTGGHSLWNQLTEIKVGENAKVNWIQIQNLSQSTLGFFRTLVSIESGAIFSAVLGSVGGAKTQSRHEFILRGENSEIQVFGASRGVMDQHFDHWTTITHEAGKTKSELRHWSVMGDQARAVFNAKVVIPAYARGCDAYQKNVNLLLSPQAVIDSLPKLEISTDEVKCAHGSSIAPVSEDQLYYLTSRGIDRGLAESMLVDGFTEPVLQKISDEELRSKLRFALIGHASDGGWDA